MQFLRPRLGRFVYKGLLCYRLFYVMLIIFISLSMSACITSSKSVKKTSSRDIDNKSKYSVYAPSPIDSLKELAPNTKLKTSLLFTEKLETTDDRVDRLEAVVQKMKDDFDTMAPSVVRLVAIEKDIKKLVKQLEDVVSEDEDKNKVVVPTIGGADILSENSSDKTNNIAKPVKLVSSNNNNKPAPNVVVSDIKIEENINATRLIMNVSDKVKFNTNWKNQKQELDIVLSNAKWRGKASWESEFSPLISSYNVKDNGKDKIVKINLNFPAKITNSDVIPAKNNNGYKLVLDLQSDAIHFE